LLDESVTGLAEYRLAPMAADQVDGVPGETRVVHDTPASLPRQENLGQKPDEVITLDELPVLVEEEAAVVVAVPGQPNVGTRTADGIRGGGAVLLQHRIGNTVGEGPIGLVVDFHELEGQMRLELIDHEPRAAVARVDDDLEV